MIKKLLDRLFNGLRRPDSEPPPDLLEREQEAERCHREALGEMQKARLGWDVRPEVMKTATHIDLNKIEEDLGDQNAELREALGRG